MPRTVHQPRQDVVLNVVNQSARTGSIAAIVLHDTESHDRAGASDIQSIGDFFNQGSVQASSHICIDGEGNTGRYVPDERKAWHCAGYNSQTLGIEQIGFATFTAAMWNRNHRAQLKKTAKWIAWWSRKYGIPIQRGAVSGGRVTRSGVLMHSELGALGGGHHDPGPGYPIWLVLRMARWYKRYGWR
jgi:N-acetyl-anhydromuramyl-L-alanine amidase AmpD